MQRRRGRSIDLGSIDLDVGVDGVIRHARYLAPRYSRTQEASVASSFRSGCTIMFRKPGADASLHRVSHRLNDTICMVFASLGRGGGGR